ncbi:MAG: cobalamin-dependent protein, partial [Calditrichia bacterium]|nr:cobalamin-dependent protein [Calditrichia bacterium]
MKILLVFPEIPDTFWSFRNALKFISKKSSEPPLGLLTLAAMLPQKWKKRLIDMNVSPLVDEHIQWADYVFLTGMNVQRQSFKEVVRRCNKLNTSVVAGGPMVSTDGSVFEGVDHYVMNEAEITLPKFIADLTAGCAKHIYSSTEFPSISQTPPPLWNLLEMDKYASMSIQYSRGCPFDCEFCSITVLNGHKPRTKNKEQLLT